MRLGVETDVTALRERFAAWPRQAEARRNSSPNPEAGLQEPARHEAGNAPHMAVRDEAEPEAEICAAAHPSVAAAGGTGLQSWPNLPAA